MTHEARSVPHDAYAALRFRDFRLLISGRFAAQVGEMMVSVAIGWELYERTHEPLALGLVGLVQVIPVILLSLPGGYVADRYNRRLIALCSQLVLMLCSLALALLSAVQGSLPLIYLCLTVIGIARAFNNPAEGALTPQTVPKEYYYNATAWSSSVWQVSSILGPAVGGLILAITQSGVAVYLTNVVAGGVLVVVLLMLHVQPHESTTSSEPPMKSLLTGIRFVRGTPVILGAISLDMFAVLLGGATFLLPVYAQDILHVDATGLGILRAAPSLGAVCMTLIIARRPPFKNVGRVLLWAVAGFGIATILFGLSTSFWFSVAMLALTGALDNISVIIRHTLILSRTPQGMMGRVSAVNTVFIGASNELGGFESGVAAALLGPVGAVVFGGFGTIAVVGALALLVPDLRRMKEFTDGQTAGVSSAAAVETSVS